MNPAALKANLADLPKGATIIVNTDAFNDRTLQKAGYAANRSRTARSPTTTSTRWRSPR